MPTKSNKSALFAGLAALAALCPGPARIRAQGVETKPFGRTWTPIFDDQPTGSIGAIGAIAVSPSDPNIVYVGSGEALARPDLSVGDGLYKSTDAAATWTHLGLRDGQQIPNIIVDPRNPERLFVAVLGDLSA